VLAETAGATQRNLTSSYTLSADEALTAGQRWVGEGYAELGKPGSGVFRSADGLQQFRMDGNSLMGNHPPPAEVADLLRAAEPTGPALKSDAAHRAGDRVIDDVAQSGSVFDLVGGDGVSRTLPPCQSCVRRPGLRGLA